MNKKWRLILDSKHDGYYNMAVDEAVLLNYSAMKIPTLRIYGWNKPFISVGYNQKISAVIRTFAKIPFVRRITGGGSIVHHNEVTYSLTCSLDDLSLPRGVKKSYEKICAFLIHFYAELNLTARFAKDILLKNDQNSNLSQAFELGQYSNFCFLAYEYYDLIIKGKKIGGNAQRRKKDIIFQHGSIPQLIDLNKVKNVINNKESVNNKFTFLDTLLGEKTDFKKLQVLLAKSFKEVFNVDLAQEDFHEDEKKTIEYLKKNKYQKQKWNLRI
ncbi:MAG: lipoate--protein ligase family protein [Candidatus Omnitrophica bacterium]|nr:lipoate--protein ligase family protein [Candidatus Omnitrophota bacterium]